MEGGGLMAGRTRTVSRTPRLGVEEWRTLLDDFDLHEGSQAEFCRLHGISQGSLFYWRRKLRQTAFVEIEAPVSTACWDVELRARGRRGVAASAAGMLNGWPQGGVWLSTQTDRHAQVVRRIVGAGEEPPSGRSAVRALVCVHQPSPNDSKNPGLGCWRLLGLGEASGRGIVCVRVDPAGCARRCFRGPNFWPLSMVWT